MAQDHSTNVTLHRGDKPGEVDLWQATCTCRHYACTSDHRASVIAAAEHHGHLVAVVE